MAFSLNGLGVVHSVVTDSFTNVYVFSDVLTERSDNIGSIAVAFSRAYFQTKNDDQNDNSTVNLTSPYYAISTPNYRQYFENKFHILQYICKYFLLHIYLLHQFGNLKLNPYSVNIFLNLGVPSSCCTTILRYRLQITANVLQLIFNNLKC